jgi:hypothetical protein
MVPVPWPARVLLRAGMREVLVSIVVHAEDGKLRALRMESLDRRLHVLEDELPSASGLLNVDFAPTGPIRGVRTPAS